MKKRIAVVLATVMLAVSFTAGVCGCASGGSDTLTHSTKPTMPNDSDMQTVEAADAVQELQSFKEVLFESKTGRFQTYSLYRNEGLEKGTFSERDENGEYNGAYDTATHISKSMTESSSSYCYKNDDGNTTGAFTYCGFSLQESNTDSTNPNLSYLNSLYSVDITHTGIQNNSQKYVYRTSKEKVDDSEEVVTPERLLYYADDSDSYQSFTNKYYLPLESDVLNYYYYGSSLYSSLKQITNSCNYVINNYDKDYLYCLEEFSYYTDFEIKDFKLTIKKNQTKLYASTKYTVELTPQAGFIWERKFDVEYMILIDLNQPDSIDYASRNGKDISKLNLKSSAADAVYPNITSEELTQAVKEGKTITVDIVGNGDVANLIVYDCLGEELPIVDGKITIDGAELKKNCYLPFTFNSLLYIYDYNGNQNSYDSLRGEIIINYSGK